MILALRGAAARAEAEFRTHVTAAWLNGLLSQHDPRSYPKLETLLSSEAEKKDHVHPTDPEEARQNARAWGVVLQAMNKRARRGNRTQA